MIKEEIATSAGDIAQSDAKIIQKPQKRDMKPYNKMEKKKKKIIKESDGYSFYQDNDYNIFEITDPQAQEIYVQGYRNQKKRYWNQNDITAEMVRCMNMEGGRNFTVKIGDNYSFPLKQQQK